MSDVFQAGVSAIKSLTLTNVLLLGLLIAVCFPAYVGYRILNDEQLLVHVASSYEEMHYGIGNCTVYRAHARGNEPEFIVRYMFRIDNLGRWYLAIKSNAEPTKEDAAKRCNLLERAVQDGRRARGVKLGPGEIGGD
jgi:hypothetical protein